MSSGVSKKSSLLEPPGGLMIWIFAFSEIFVFICAIAAFYYQRSSEVEIFIESQKQLSKLLATINTMCLLTSSYFVVRAVNSFDSGKKNITLRNLFFSILFAIAFLFIKGSEYKEKLSLNLTLGTNTFFDFYWILTSFHAIHVLIGVFVLMIMSFFVYKDKPFDQADMGFHTGANYWHLCDLIWIMIFPVLYIL